MHILVAVDFSSASAWALRNTADWAKKLGAKVSLVHAFSPGVHAPTLMTSNSDNAQLPLLESETEIQLEEAHKLSEIWARFLRDQDIDVEVIANPGQPSTIILEAAKATQPEMLIIGRSGHGKLRRAIMGSVSRYVAEHAECPVLIVPTQ